MKKLFLGLVLLFGLYFTFEWAFVYFNKGHELTYEIIKDNHKFVVNEILTSNQGDDRDNYYLKVSYDDIIFTYQVFDDFSKQSEIIKDIIYYEDEENKCIIPVFKGNKYLFDVTCYDGKIFSYYNSITSPNEGLKIFVSNLENYGYNKKDWTNSLKKLDEFDTITVYNNLISDHYIGVSSYKGVSLINKHNFIKNIDIFNKDVYQRTISAFVNNFYITADYTGINNFNQFEVVNLKNGEVSKIDSKYNLSFNSYVLGVVENSLYIYDKDNRIEYEINLKTKNISIIGQKDKYIKYYSNGTWMDLDIKDVADNQVFNVEQINDYNSNDYVHVIKKGNRVGYYYLFKLFNNKYQVYRTDIQNKSNLTYLFTATDYNKIIFLEDYIYYLDNNDLKYYSDKTGSKTVLKNTEFEFNKTIRFGVYEKVG